MKGDMIKHVDVEDADISRKLAEELEREGDELLGIRGLAFRTGRKGGLTCDELGGLRCHLLCRGCHQCREERFESGLLARTFSSMEGEVKSSMSLGGSRAISPGVTLRLLGIMRPDEKPRRKLNGMTPIVSCGL